MESFWKGSFAKHRLYTSDVANHIRILTIALVDVVSVDDLVSDIAEEAGIDLENVDVLGDDGPNIYLVRAEWIHGEGVIYQYIYTTYSDEPPTFEMVMKSIEEYVHPKA